MDKPTTEILEEICDAFCKLQTKTGEVGRVKLFEVAKRNILNYSFSGEINLGGTVYLFRIDDGDWNGTEVLDWGTDGVDLDIEPNSSEPCPLTFIPCDPFLKFENPAMWAVYLQWRKEDWFREMERKYHYDRHFQPGSFIENHYRDWAAKKGMVIGIFEE